MPTTPVRDEARKLIDQLPDDATWEDLLAKIYLRTESDVEHRADPDGKDTPISTDTPSIKFSSLKHFLQGIGSVLEFFPPVERFDPWRIRPSLSMDEWPVVVRGILSELSERDPNPRGVE